MVTIKAMLNSDRESKSGLYPLVIRVIHNRKKRLIYLPYKLPKANFDSEKERMIYIKNQPFNRNQVKVINCEVEKAQKEVKSIVERFSELGKPFSVADIVDKYRQRLNNEYIVTFSEKLIERKKNINKNGTASIYKSSLNSLKRYMNGKNVRFCEVDHRFVSGYIDFLSKRGIAKNSSNTYVNNFHTVYNTAHNEGITVAPTTPFANIHLHMQKTRKRALPKQQIRAMTTLDLTDEPLLDQARDVFMFSFYTRGMSFVDIIHLKQTDITDGIIDYQRSKTGQHIRITVLDELQQFIAKYRSDGPYIFPWLNHVAPKDIYKRYRQALSACNRHLKKVGELLGIETKLTSYVARHSWATIAQNVGAPISSISGGLGHNSERTTRIYLDELDPSLVDKVNSMVACL